LRKYVKRAVFEIAIIAAILRTCALYMQFTGDIVSELDYFCTCPIRLILV